MKLPIVDDAAGGFPPLLRAWISEAVPGPIPRETLATCDSCAMVAPEGEGAGDSYFERDLKCCSYFPRLANFLVGGLLADPDPALAEGRARVDARIAKRVAVTPLGVSPPKQFSLLYGPGSGGFGRTKSLRCPYFAEASGGCTVWRHRNGVCTTWFCKHERGGVGGRFWRALERLSTLAEQAVARHCVLELDVGARSLAALFPHPSDPSPPEALDDLDGRVDEDRYALLWGRWLGRERALYEESAKVVAAMRWDDVRRVGGSELEARLRIARAAFEALASRDLPERVRTARIEIASVAGGAAQIVTYSRFDPVDVPADLLALLPRFDGAPLADVLRAIEEETGIVVEHDLVQKLLDFGVLAPT